MSRTEKNSTRRTRAGNARLPNTAHLAVIDRESAPPPAVSLDLHAGERVEYSLRVAFTTSPDDPAGRGRIDDLAAALKDNGIAVTDVRLSIDARSLMTPEQVARRDELHRRAAEQRERSIASRRAVEARVPRTPSPGSHPPRSA